MTDTRSSPGTATPDDFAALREVEVAWLSRELGRAIKNLAYPVGCGAAPTDYHLEAAAKALFERYAKMIEMARNAGGAAQAGKEPDEQLWGRFVNHYWDSFEGDKEIILKHVKAVLDYHAENAAPPSPVAGEARPSKFSPGDPVEVREVADEIDEIVIRRGDVHIEQMDDSGWFMGVDASDGSYWQFWFGAKNRKSHVHFRHTETVPSTEGK